LVLYTQLFYLTSVHLLGKHGLTFQEGLALPLLHRLTAEKQKKGTLKTASLPVSGNA
jgi:hypothetical protein